jgi:peroxiredoxin
MFRISLRFALGAAAAILAASAQVGAAAPPPPLAIGAPAPDFSLPGVDGKTYTLASFKDAKALVVVFTAVHCPTAEVYEARLKKLVADYTPKGVAFAVIQPNNAKAVRLDEMGYTDLGDSIEDMKARAEHRAFNFPFLYDGETQEATTKYGPVATPHVFVFDRARTLRYQGRIDSSPREVYAKVADTRIALDAVLAGGKVPVEKTPTVGCSIKWLDKTVSASAEQDAIKQEPVTVTTVDAAGLEALVRNADSGKTRLINFWATWCAPCTAEFPDLQATWRMYRKRPFELVTVAINFPDEEAGVRKFLEAQHATTRNLLFGATDPYALMKVVDPDWNGSVPYSMVIAPGGKVLFKGNGTLDMLKTRRLILASFPDDDYVGQNAYWNSK